MGVHNYVLSKFCWAVPTCRMSNKEIFSFWVQVIQIPPLRSVHSFNQIARKLTLNRFRIKYFH